MPKWRRHIRWNVSRYGADSRSELIIGRRINPGYFCFLEKPKIPGDRHFNQRMTWSDFGIAHLAEFTGKRVQTRVYVAQPAAEWSELQDRVRAARDEIPATQTGNNEERKGSQKGGVPHSFRPRHREQILTPSIPIGPREAPETPKNPGLRTTSASVWGNERGWNHSRLQRQTEIKNVAG